jgi:hypothetical protein
MRDRVKGRGRRGLAVLVATTTLVAASLTSCDPFFDVVITNPGMYPVFQRSITDYVNRCDPARPTQVNVKAPPGARVSVASRPVKGGTFTASVNQRYNERFRIVITHEGTTTIHNVRCLPRDFPQWSAEGNGERAQSEWYVTTLVNGFAPNRPVIFDANGVPMWWSEAYPAVLTTPLPNGNLATLHFAGGMLERRLDGTTVRTLDTQGASSDFHDVLLLPNGNYVLVTLENRACDLTSWGRDSNGTCVFHEVQELTPSGAVVWRWAAEDDIPITETPPRWRSVDDPLTNSVDPWHYNSIEWVGDGFIVSFRHQDAVYKVDYATKDIVWKIGGTRRAESLRVLNDPIFTKGSSISGQHDARMLPDGTLSIYDNRTNSTNGRQPRVVRYRIDEVAGTATLVSTLRDSIAPVSPCCGSARRLPTGNWVVAWGGGEWFTENKPDGTQIFRLRGGSGIYRVIPLGPGVYTREQVRVGMDAQYDGASLSPSARSGPQLPAGDPEALGDVEFRLGTKAQPAG